MGLGETLCDLSQARNRAIQKYLEMLSEYNEEDCSFYQTRSKRKLSSNDTLLEEFSEKSDMHEDQGPSFFKKESVILRPRVVS